MTYIVHIFSPDQHQAEAVMNEVREAVPKNHNRRRNERHD